MEKIIAMLLAAALFFSLTACGNQANTLSEETMFPSESMSTSESMQTQGPGTSLPDEAEEPETESGKESNESKAGEVPASNILVAYFSWADNAILGEDVDAVASPSVIAPGNVQELAGWVQEETGGELFSIRVTEPYSSDWDDCLARANQERGDNARPALEESVESLDQYDTVFLGYPNWWYGVPMALLTFLEENDLSGKQVYLFCSHGTGGLASSVELITEAAPGAIISDNIFDCYEEEASSSRSDIQDWVSGLGY